MCGKRARGRLTAGAALLLAASLAAPAAAVEGAYGPLPLRPRDREIVEKSAQIGDLFERKGYVLPDGPLTALVQRVGTAVAPTPSDDYVHYRFRVVRDPVPNAFALADGQVYVHEGLLAVLTDEAQLAAVLSHEVTHVEGHHPILDARQARQKVGGMIALQVIFGPVGDLIDIGLAAAMVGYGRDLEEEADKHAAPRMLAAGYDPREMPKIFDLLAQDPEGERLPQSPTWSNHPLDEARKEYTTALLKTMGPDIAAAEARGPLHIEADSFRAAVAPCIRDVVAMDLDADRPRTALGLVRGALARDPDDAEAQALLGECYRALDARLAVLPAPDLTRKAKRSRLREEERLTREERAAARRNNPALASVLAQNEALAREAYEKALVHDAAQPLALRGLGFLAEDRGDLLDAGRYFSGYVKSAPEALDRPEILARIASLTRELRASPAHAGGVH